MKDDIYKHRAAVVSTVISICFAMAYGFLLALPIGFQLPRDVDWLLYIFVAVATVWSGCIGAVFGCRIAYGSRRRYGEGWRFGAIFLLVLSAFVFGVDVAAGTTDMTRQDIFSWSGPWVFLLVGIPLAAFGAVGGMTLFVLIDLLCSPMSADDILSTQDRSAAHTRRRLAVIYAIAMATIIAGVCCAFESQYHSYSRWVVLAILALTAYWFSYRLFLKASIFGLHAITYGIVSGATFGFGIEHVLNLFDSDGSLYAFFSKCTIGAIVGMAFVVISAMSQSWKNEIEWEVNMMRSRDGKRTRSELILTTILGTIILGMTLLFICFYFMNTKAIPELMMSLDDVELGTQSIIDQKNEEKLPLDWLNQDKNDVISSSKEGCARTEERAIAYLPRDLAKRYCDLCDLTDKWDVCAPASLKTQNKRIWKLQQRFNLSCEEMSILKTIIEMSYGKEPMENTYNDQRLARWYRRLPGLARISQDHLEKKDKVYREKSLPKASRHLLRWFRIHKSQCQSLVKISTEDLKLLYSLFPLKKAAAADILVMDGRVIDDPINDGSSSWIFERPLSFNPAYRFSYSKIDSPIFYDKWSSDSRIKSSDQIITVSRSTDDLFSTCVDVGQADGCDFSPREFSFAIRSNKLVGVFMAGGAACPYVYTRQADGSYKKEGEILRNLRRPGLETVQSLALKTPVTPGQRFTIDLREEKPETTYLDSVWLDLCGTRIAPTSCASAEGASRPDYCDADNVYDTFSRGESRKFIFDIPASSTCDSASLFAEGYYVPVN